MQCLPEIRKLPKIIASIDRIPKLIQIIVEHTTQYLAGSVADHRDVHRNQIPFKGGIPALLDSVPKALPGLFTKPIHADDFSPVTIQTVNIQITMDKSLTDEFFQCSLRQPFNVHCLLADKMDELFQPTCLAVRVITVQRLDDAILAIFALST